ncbi:MAG TPA: bifunctional diaminohydroxyphosphoribosylaminopyrimidine deaminase/5-amino-6-(5-phosphoribosylamino)uracil reductase RibD [Longimicrobiales bacterium]|nr:bifunctional diaminohydroxyphosphoribosylaminopyrimidine deaminase/5-amino-6-(5-phosphoribosylamino)uracil reductase RibD [Longimicrobiales bacterium]
MMAAADDGRFMRRALALATEGWGRVHPNPLVGAVVVRDGEVVGEGAHREFGGPHAEVEALRAAGERARGATLYVTLEPCAHHGKTPPCTDAVRAAGIRRLVYAVADPHQDARGGARVLAESGVLVEGGVEEAAARRQNALFLVPLERGRPFVALKYGMSLDARLGRQGERTPVTGRAAQEEAHRLRAGFDAVLVGGRTARVDDPRLTVRHGPPPRVPPTRVVVDTAGDLPEGGHLVRTARETPVVLVTGPDPDASRLQRLEDAGVQVVKAPGAAGQVDLTATLAVLAGRGITTIFCEGGGRLGAGLLAADLVDRVYLFTAPRVLGSGTVPAFPEDAFPAGPPVARFRVSDARVVGADALLVLDRSD